MENPVPYTRFFYDWTFVQGKPEPGWECKRRDGKRFRLDACINLDKLCDTPPVPDVEEGVLYADFEVGEDGTAFIGLGCNWCLEAYCDGALIKSTFDPGNGQSYVFPCNHRVFFPVTAGHHLMAIHVRRGRDNWDFACGYTTLLAPPEPKLAYGPWLTNPDAGKMTIAFSCETPLGAAVRYRKVGEGNWQTVWHHRQGQCLRRTYHAIPLTELEPGMEYDYQIIVIHPDKYIEVPLGETHRFRVPDLQRHSYSFFFTADLQFPLERQHVILGRMLEAADASTCDFFVLDGDVNSAFLPEDVIRGPFAQLCEHGAAEKPIVYVRGNHEMRGEHGDRFLDFFATNIGTTYDVIRIGDTAFLLLDSWEDKPAKTPGHTYCQWNMDRWFIDAETSWLKNAMADNKWTGAKRRMVICHSAPYSHFDGCRYLPFVLQKMTDPYFEGQVPESPLNLWLAGHVHRYLRSIPGTDDIVAEVLPPAPFKGGKTYRYPVLTVGGPGANRNIQASCFRVDADEDGFTIKAWDQNGELLEHLRYGNDGVCQEIVALPHFTVSPDPRG